MRSSTKSESNCNNNSDNLNNNLDEVDKRSSEDVIDIADSECSSNLLNQGRNGESELTQRAEHVDSDKSAKVNVCEQVKDDNYFMMTETKICLFSSRRFNGERKPSPWKEKLESKGS